MLKDINSVPIILNTGAGVINIKLISRTAHKDIDIYPNQNGDLSLK